jgi:SAM-dependent methyltransferase
MWKSIQSKHNGRRIHPKHLALPDSHHHWYAEHIQKGWHVLDLGCDRGGHVPSLLDAGATVVGVDHNEEAIGEAEKRQGAEFEVVDLEGMLPFENGSFDAALALDVIEHLHERNRFLAEIHRVVKPGGLVFFSAPNIETTWKTTARELGLFEMSDPDHKIEYSEPELIGLIEKSGFQINATEPVVFDTPWADWIDFLGAVSLDLYKKAWMRKRKKALADPMESTGFRIIAQRLKDPAHD